MSSFRVLKWFVLLLLLPLTLGWKLAVRPVETGTIKEEAAQLKVAEFLRRQYFSVALSEKMEEGQPAVRATSGMCRILVAKSPALGWDRDLIRRNATPADEVFVVFEGKIYAEQPTWLTVSNFLWSRLQRELGWQSQPAAVLAVIATSACQAQRLPWNELKL